MQKAHANLDKAAFALLGLAVAFVVGCQPRSSLMNGHDLSNGLIIVLPGIGGTGPGVRELCIALSEADTRLAVELYDWTICGAPLLNQMAIRRNRSTARTLADRITAYRRRHPSRPIWLIGHSGGTAIAIWAAEKLPEDEPIEGVILLASSLSPEYDLTAALEGVRTEIVSFFSPRDFGLLGAGTSLVGTMDGKRCRAAGMIGFTKTDGLPDGRDSGVLRQVSWHPEMARWGYDGGHFSICSRGFIRSYVVPIIEHPALVASAQ